MIVSLGQQYNVGKKPTVILYTYINHHAQLPVITQHTHFNKYIVTRIVLMSIIVLSNHTIAFIVTCTLFLLLLHTDAVSILHLLPLLYTSPYGPL